MVKNLLVALIGVLFFQNASAQSPKDTIVYFMKEPERIVDDKSEAEFVRYVMPADSSSGTKIYPVFEYYTNSKRRLVGATTRTSQHLYLEGGVTRFYPNGKRKNYGNYHNGDPNGEFIRYYPNGQVYTVWIFDAKNLIQQFKECRDSTGKVLAENGNGTWPKFDEDFNKIVEQGPVKNGLEEGEWNVTNADNIKIVYNYRKGHVVSRIAYDNTGKAYPFKQADVEPTPKGGFDEFYDFLKDRIKYPQKDYDLHVTGKVMISFHVQKDGRLTDFRIVSGPSEAINEEALRVVRLSSPWIPAYHYGLPVAMDFMVPVNFTIH